MIEATNQVGAGKKITDRSGNVWEYGVYESPSGPAFWLTLPDKLCPEWAANYTVHFDGVMGVSQPHAGLFRRINERAAQGDPDMAYLAEEFTDPRQLLGGEE